MRTNAGTDGTDPNYFLPKWSAGNDGRNSYLRNGEAYFNRADKLGTPHLTTDYNGVVQRTEGGWPSIRFTRTPKIKPPALTGAGG